MKLDNHGVKLAEVSVYALSREEFNRKVEARKRSHFEKYGSGASELSFEIEYGKSRYYDYNHIIGYIVVLKKRMTFYLNYINLIYSAIIGTRERNISSTMI